MIKVQNVHNVYISFENIILYCHSIYFQCRCCKVLVIWYGTTVQSCTCSYTISYIKHNLFSRLFIQTCSCTFTLPVISVHKYFLKNFSVKTFIWLLTYVPLLLVLYTCAVRLVCKINIAFWKWSYSSGKFVQQTKLVYGPKGSSVCTMYNLWMCTCVHFVCSYCL